MKRLALIVVFWCWATLVWSLPASEFFAEPDMLTARLSPDGKLVAAITGVEENQSLVVIDTDTGQRTSLLKVTEFSENEASLLTAIWLDDVTIAATFTEVRAGVEDLLDTRGSRYLLIIRVPQIAGAEPEILSVRTSGVLVNPLPDAPGDFLYAKSSALSRVYRINVDSLAAHNATLSRLDKIDGGQFVRSNQVAEIEGYALRWFMNTDTTPRAVLNLDDGDLVMTAFDSPDKTRELARWGALSEEEDENTLRLIPVAVADGVDRYYCLDINARSTTSVYLMDYAADEHEVIFTSSDGEIADFITTEGEGELVGVSVVQSGRLRHIYFEADRTAGKSADNSSTLELTIGYSRDGQKRLQYIESHDQPGRFLLATSAGANRSLGGHMTHLVGRLNSELVTGNVKVEGLDIEYLLSLPRAGSPSPLVVMPHGGPAEVYDTPYFDPTTQYLTANGYAVLRVSFRGSGGHSGALVEAGKREYGALMLTDIHAATREVMARPDIDATRVAVFGASYGGYAATMLAIQHPDTYRCAVTLAGVMDINLWLNRADFTEPQRRWAREYIGDPAVEYDKLKAISPISLVHGLTVPILVMHGDMDEVVDIEHAYRLRHLLTKFEKDHQWHVFEDGQHSFTSVQDAIELHDRVLEFLSAYLH